MSGCKDCGMNRISPNSFNFTDIGFWLCNDCLIKRVLKYEKLKVELEAAQSDARTRAEKHAETLCKYQRLRAELEAAESQPRCDLISGEPGHHKLLCDGLQTEFEAVKRENAILSAQLDEVQRRGDWSQKELVIRNKMLSATEAELETAKKEIIIQAAIIEAMARDLAEKFYYNPQMFGENVDWNNLEEGTKNVVVANIVIQRRDEIAQAEKTKQTDFVGGGAADDGMPITVKAEEK